MAAGKYITVFDWPAKGTDANAKDNLCYLLNLEEFKQVFIEVCA